MEARPDTQPLTVGSLFAGIGGFDLGLERAGMRTRWFVEQDPFCQRVLAKHWPDVPCYGDICGLTGATLSPVDVLCGGFPCQDISVAGKGAGIAEGTRSGLWSEYARLVGELRPRYVIVENVSALLARGLDRVLGDLAALGYDAEWDCIPASAVGAPHRRDRVWIVAYPGCERGAVGREARDVASAARTGQGDDEQRERNGHSVDDRGSDVADAERQRWHGWEDVPRRNVANGQAPQRGEGADRTSRRDTTGSVTPRLANSECEGLQGRSGGGESREGRSPVVATSIREGFGGQWLTEPDVGRVANGVPARVDRLRSLGNALVPQIAEWIGRRIVEWEASGSQVP